MLSLLYSQSIFSLSLFCKLNFFRFAAEKRSAPNNYLPVGDIKGYNELIDVGNNFNPSTGVFKVGNKEEDVGTYVFFYSGRKSGYEGQYGDIFVKKNGQTVQSNYEDLANYHLQMNGILSFNLKKGDEIKLHNRHDNSIFVPWSKPFTFTGYKI